MSQQELMQNPPFREIVRASGAAEVWTHTTDDHKLTQFGWRCTNTESSYKTDTLIGNWSEERFDIEKRKKAEPLSSQFGHNFSPVYNSSYNTVPKAAVPEELKNLKDRHSHAHPHHQPELDSESLKAIYNSWKTTQRADYLDPCIRKQPYKPSAEKTATPVAK